ncbi:hypothetical protein Lal_00000740 [Lupinus albus]|nr:hypothetical protein Lal_00000740 [Lupinus albus]
MFDNGKTIPMLVQFLKEREAKARSESFVLPTTYNTQKMQAPEAVTLLLPQLRENALIIAITMRMWRLCNKNIVTTSAI